MFKGGGDQAEKRGSRVEAGRAGFWQLSPREWQKGNGGSKEVTSGSCKRAFIVHGDFRAEQEAKITSEKDAHIKSVEAEILQLKADIYNLKDVYRKYSMYGKFLAAISPEDWRKEQV